MSMREEFEAWWIDRHGNREGIASPAKEKIAREAWQASRAALVVELPTIEDAGTLTSGVAKGVLRDCRAAIEAAGVQVKP